MRNTAARNFAIAKDAPAIVVKPSTAAITPITRNVKAQTQHGDLHKAEPPHQAERVPERLTINIANCMPQLLQLARAVAIHRSVVTSAVGPSGSFFARLRESERVTDTRAFRALRT